ncbi:MAG: D-alanyl-D-alanine carboxypeptidase, partial [Amylibacter sp.]
MITVTTNSTFAAPYAAVVMDARTGQILHSRNADTRLHPASLTKMMTLYVVFQAIERGEITLDTKVKVSKNATNEPPSKLGLRTGQKIALRYLVRASAVKSANDAATAMGEAISGSEAAFARRMTETGRRLGMKHTTFKNAHGLTRSGHLSTARDMTLLGRRLFYDYPQYYNLFSRKTTDAGIKQVYNTNRRLLGNYRGADGIKTGFTNAAGFNLVASAHRGNKRVIATVFGGKTSSWRNARVAELLDMGFSRVDTRLAEKKPAKIAPVTLEQSKIIKVAAVGA